LGDSLAIYIKLLWDNRLNNPKIPIGKKKMFSRGIFVIGGGIIAFVGFLISNFLIVPFLNTSYIDIINLSFLKMTFCGIWLIISIPLLPFIMFAIASPAGLKSSVKSMKKLMET
jgi:cell division protein FtsX